MSTVLRIAELIRESKSFVAFTGAGISTESGIPDFRSPGGIWATSKPVYFHDFLRSESARHEYWRQKAESQIDFENASPNIGHLTLAKWEKTNRLRGVITQNIDGLHQLAGNQRVLELHGTARFIACLDCRVRYDAKPVVEQYAREQVPPQCPECGGLLKHATVSFGQQLPQDVLEEAIEWSCQADLFLAMGSSLVVQPAAGLPVAAQRFGARLVIINRDPTPVDSLADIVVHGPIGETLKHVDECLES